MIGDIQHECDHCKKEAVECFCADCLEAEKQDAYDEGYSEGQEEQV